jgi:hypothetical protein
VSRGGYVGIATRLRAGWSRKRGSISDEGDGLFSISSRPIPVPALYNGDQGLKRPRREADHSPPSSAEVNNSGVIRPLPLASSGRV